MSQDKSTMAPQSSMDEEEETSEVKTCHNFLKSPWFNKAVTVIAIVAAIVILCLLYLSVMLTYCAATCGADCLSIFLKEIISIISIIIAGLTLFITVIAAICAIRTLRATQSVSEACFLYEADTNYGSGEMLDSLQVLEKFKKEHAPESGSDWILEDKYRTDENNPDSRIQVAPFRIPEKVGNARRRVKFYFKSLHDLYVHGKISKNALENILADKGGMRFFFEVVEPLEYLHNPDYDYKLFYELMHLLKPYYKKHSRCNISNDLLKDEELPSGKSKVVQASEPVSKYENTSEGKRFYECRSLNESYEVKIIGIRIFTRIINRTEKKQ